MEGNETGRRSDDGEFDIYHIKLYETNKRMTIVVDVDVLPRQ